MIALGASPGEKYTRLKLPHTLKIDCSLTCNNPFSFHLQVKRKINAGLRLGVRFLLARPVYIGSLYEEGQMTGKGHLTGAGDGGHLSEGK